MKRINNFFYYVGLFTISAFRNHWKAIGITVLVFGTATACISQNPWNFIPCFMGAYLAALYSEYIDYKKGEDT